MIILMKMEVMKCQVRECHTVKQSLFSRREDVYARGELDFLHRCVL